AAPPGASDAPAAGASRAARPRGPIITYLPSAAPEPAPPPAPRLAEVPAPTVDPGPQVRLVPPATPDPSLPAGPQPPASPSAPEPAAPSMGVAPGYGSGSTDVAPPAGEAPHDHPGLRGFTYIPVMIGAQSPPSLLTGLP